MSKIGEMYNTTSSVYEIASNGVLVDDSVKVGVELEVEGLGTSVHQLNLNFWKTTHDGSLRGSYATEFITGLKIGRGNNIPLCGRQVVEALSEINTVFSKMVEAEQPPEYSDRTSVHVHLDVANMTPIEVYNLVLLSIVFEKPLFHFAANGFDRLGNNFCLPLTSDSAFHDELWRLKEDVERGYHRLKDIGLLQKYFSVNLLPIMSCGSIEFRHMGGTSDTDRILNWINILLSLRKYAEQLHKDGVEVIGLLPEISAKGFLEFSKNIFGDLHKLLNYQGFEKDVLGGVRLVQEIGLREQRKYADMGRIPTQDGEGNLVAFKKKIRR
jgi:hypothetical protein